MAIFKEYDIIVDLLNGIAQDRKIVFDQNDVNTSKLNITLTNKTVPINLTGTAVTIAFLKRDRTAVYQPCTITNAVEGEVEVILNAQTLAVPGLVKAELTIDSGTSTVTTSAFFFNVKDSIMNDQTVQSANEFSVIQKAIDAGETLGDVDLETIVNNTNNVNNIKSEVETARGGKASLDTRLDDIDTVLEQNRLQLTDSNKQSQVLTHGTQLINATQNSPVDFEIQGRTLIPLQNSNMDASKYYVLADKKTKVKVEGREGSYVAGVGKFQKSAAVSTTGNFVGKVGGSIVENPHLFKRTGSASLLDANSASFLEYESQYYLKSATLDGNVQPLSYSTNGYVAQHLFSFNIIEQVERKMGRIPAVDTAGKVQWLKDNINKLLCSWNGYGSSPTGNKATISWWTGSWTGAWSHTNPTVTKIDAHSINGSTAWFSNAMDSNGFVHLLAYADASDGVTASTINTDYVECVIELKSTAVLDTRPQVLRVANFEGRINGSTVENPHTAKATSMLTLQAPNGGWQTPDDSTFNYGNLSKLDGNVRVTTNGIAGTMAQQLFSFDLIAEIERNIGRIPRTSVADKVAWLKANVKEIKGAWHGFGSSVGGSKASLSVWSYGAWATFTSHTSSSISSIIGYTNSPTAIDGRIQSDGMFHLLAHAEPSDGVTASTINTDYISLEIELKPEAILHDPSVPLYEVTTDEYNKILVDWNEASVLTRYPKVTGVQHLQNPYVMAEGENLLPPFSEWTGGSAEFIIISPYEGILKAPSTSNTYKFIDIPVVGGQIVTFVGNKSGNGIYKLYEYNNGSYNNVSKTNNNTWTLSNTTNILRVELNNYAQAGETTFTQPMLTLGSTAKPFVPRNPSYLFAETKLGQIGTLKDVLYRDADGWKVRKVVEKDVVLDGSTPWSYSSDGVGYKIIRTNFSPTLNAVNYSEKVTKYDGSIVISHPPLTLPNRVAMYNGHLNFTLLDSDTGWADSYIPVADEIKAYFNGWQVKTADGANKPTAWKSIVDGSDAPTQTLAYVSVNKAPNYTPYKLSYVLATPVTQVVNVEGDIAVSGSTQVEVGSGVIVREKVVPAYRLVGSENRYYINHINFGTSTSWTSRKLKNFVSINKNGVSDKSWNIYKDGMYSYGDYGAYTLSHDATAEYTVTYLILDRHLFTNNAQEVKAMYDGSLKSVVDSLVTSNADQETFISVNVKAIAELYKRVKALGG